MQSCCHKLHTTLCQAAAEERHSVSVIMFTGPIVLAPPGLLAGAVLAPEAERLQDGRSAGC